MRLQGGLVKGTKKDVGIGVVRKVIMHCRAALTFAPDNSQQADPESTADCITNTGAVTPTDDPDVMKQEAGE